MFKIFSLLKYSLFFAPSMHWFEIFRLKQNSKNYIVWRYDYPKNRNNTIKGSISLCIPNILR